MPMRQVVYSVAMSLDGYIAGPRGEADWIVMDPDINFDSIFARFDVILMGRKTYEATRSSRGGGGGHPGPSRQRSPTVARLIDASRASARGAPVVLEDWNRSAGVRGHPKTS